jgi:multidrug efflux pump subunit AcrA (membrane-fusion protein)
VDENGVVVPPFEIGTVQRRDITIGRLLDTQMRIVTRFLEPGETYIVRGVQRVRIGMDVIPTSLEDYNIRLATESEQRR